MWMVIIYIWASLQINDQQLVIESNKATKIWSSLEWIVILVFITNPASK